MPAPARVLSRSVGRDPDGYPYETPAARGLAFAVPADSLEFGLKDANPYNNRRIRIALNAVCLSPAALGLFGEGIVIVADFSDAVRPISFAQA